MNTWKKCLSTENSNTGRQIELDIAKAFAIIFMVWCHTLEEFNDELSGILPTIIDDFLGGPFAAPVFMFCMGIGVVYSKNNTPQQMMKRGCRILLTGYFLNLIRYGIPAVITHFCGGSATEYTNSGQLFFEVDILEFAGPAFFIMGLLKLTNATPYAMGIIAAVLSVLGTIFRNVTIANPVASQFLGYFVGTKISETCFPLFNWLIFVVAGYIFGNLYLHCTDKNLFYKYDKQAFSFGLLYFICSECAGFGIFGETAKYYYMGTVDHIAVLCFIYGLLGIYYKIMKFFPQNAIAFSKELSANINAVYCIHWVVIMISSTIIFIVNPDLEMGLSAITITALLILFVSCESARWYKTVI